jgi:hypothetical protein
VPSEESVSLLLMGAGPVDPPALRALPEIRCIQIDIFGNKFFNIILVDSFQDQIASQTSAEEPFRRGFQGEFFNDFRNLLLNAVLFDDKEPTGELLFSHGSLSGQDNPPLLLGSAQKIPIRNAMIIQDVITEDSQPRDQPAQIGIGDKSQVRLVFFRNSDALKNRRGVSGISFHA